MNKLLTYIKHGKGYGLLFLLASAVVITILYMINFKTVFSEIKPQIELVAEDFLPITIKDKQIVSHPNTYKSVYLQLGDATKSDFNLPIIMNTQDTYAQLPKEKTAIYLSKEYFHIITPNEIKKIEYSDGTYDINTFKKLMNKTIGLASSFVTATIIIFLFINFLIKSIMLFFFSNLIIKITKLATMPREELCKICAISISFIELLCAIIAKLLNQDLGLAISSILSVSIIITYLLYNQKTHHTDTL